MKKDRELIQREALEKLKENNYNGCIALSTGTGKTKIAIDAIKQANFKNILITSPRTNLKENWKRELEKWEIISYLNLPNIRMFPSYYYSTKKGDIKITLENIQTCYKWSFEQLNQFDLVICDEIHTIATEKYGSLIEKVRKNNIPVIGLTATPDNKKEDKQLFYNTYCPIIYEYYDSAKDGIINKRRHLVFQYNLSNDDKVSAGTKKNPFLKGELEQYEYLTNQITKGQQLMSATGSQDWWKDSVEWFYNKKGNSVQRYAGMMYLNAIRFRKNFLWNLTSSSRYALQIKKAILKSKKNKVLLFSENIKQAKKLSKYCIHSKQDKDINKELLENFDKGNIRELSSVKSLTLGLNIEKANYIIRESYNGSEVNMLQLVGRSDRLDINDTATVIWIVPTDTQAEQWFNNSIKNSTEDIEYFTDINKLIKKL